MFFMVSTRISAFVLVCGQVLADVGLFALALVFLVMAFAILGSPETTSGGMRGSLQGGVRKVQLG